MNKMWVVRFITSLNKLIINKHGIMVMNHSLAHKEFSIFMEKDIEIVSFSMTYIS